MTEEVLVFPRTVLDEIGTFQGFQKVDADVPNLSKFAPIFEPKNQRFMPRPAAEVDPNYKQLIPYVIMMGHDPLTKEYGILNYWRDCGMGEKRLHGKRSIGVGGHINPEDADNAAIDRNTYSRGVLREQHEELFFDRPVSLWMPVVGFINDDTTEVGKVHFGVVHACEIPDNVAVSPQPDGIKDFAYDSLAALVRCRGDFEPWSQFCLDMLKDELQATLELARGAIKDASYQ